MSWTDLAPIVKTRPRVPPKKKLDIVAYLGGKNHKVAKRADGTYSIDGTFASKARAVSIINEYRARVQLPTITADQAE